MKRLTFGRGKSKDIIEIACGDKYDSYLEIEDETGKLLYRSEHINTDPSTKGKGGILKSGCYYGIVGLHKGKYKAVKFFNIVSDDRLSKIKTADDLTWQERRMPSKVPNPNQDDSMFMDAINFHKGGFNENLSLGCFTQHPYEYEKSMSFLEMNEIVKVMVLE